jgi:hypothetical protein
MPEGFDKADIPWVLATGFHSKRKWEHTFQSTISEDASKKSRGSRTEYTWNFIQESEGMKKQ